MAKKSDKTDVKDKEKTKKTKGKETKKKETKVIKLDPAKEIQLAFKGVRKALPDALGCFMYEEEKLIRPTFSSGLIGIDLALGGFGLPKGRIIELYGPSGGGKTSLGLEIMWQLQQQTGLGFVFVDAEHKFHGLLLKSWRGGFIPTLTILEEPWSGEEAVKLLKHYLESPAIGGILLDSVSGLISVGVIDDKDNSMANQARLISKHLPALSGLASKTNTVLMVINQIRSKMDPRLKGYAGHTKSGGNALEHWNCVSLYVRREATLTGDDKALLHPNTGALMGHWAEIRVMKNHAGPTYFQKFNLCLTYGIGFDNVAELTERAIGLGIVGQAGSWFSYEDFRAQGKRQVVDYIRNNPEIQSHIWDAVRDQTLSNNSPFVVESEFDEEEKLGDEFHNQPVMSETGVEEPSNV